MSEGGCCISGLPVLVLVGTKAQYIKTAPVLLAMRRRGMTYRLVYTGQHSETFAELEAAFELPTAEDVLVAETEADSRLGLLSWAFRFVFASIDRIRRGSWKGCSWGVVHGDTASTLLSAIVLRLAGVKVAHVEAGLRSPRLFSPFPEEIIRRLVSLLASLHFAPSPAALANLSNSRGVVVDTNGNTMKDALVSALEAGRNDQSVPDARPYAIATMHRTENLSTKASCDLLLEEIIRASATIEIVFVLHPVTRRALADNGWLAHLEAEPRILLASRTDYFTFVAKMLGASFLMTDGGSNQEEAALLGLPTIVLRKESERDDGFDEGTVVMSNLDRGIIREFVVRTAATTWSPKLIESGSPSEVIVDHLRGAIETFDSRAGD